MQDNCILPRNVTPFHVIFSCLCFHRGISGNLTSVSYCLGSWDMNECALAVDAARINCSSFALRFPTFKLSLIVPEKSDGSCETAATFLLTNFRSRSFML